MTRHIGRHKDNNEQVAVVWMLIPDQTTHALVAFPDRISGPLRNELMSGLASGEAQSNDTLANVLGRRQFADSQKSLLQVLHETQQLHRVSIDDIQMTPDGNHRIGLRTVLESIGWLRQQPGAEKFNPHTYNTMAGTGEENVSRARNLLVEADLLEGDAARKRAQAYQIAPSLNPAATQAPASEPAPEAPATDTTTNEQ